MEAAVSSKTLVNLYQIWQHTPGRCNLIQLSENLKSRKRGFNSTQLVRSRVMISAVFTHTSQYRSELGRTVSAEESGGSVQQKADHTMKGCGSEYRKQLTMHVIVAMFRIL